MAPTTRSLGKLKSKLISRRDGLSTGSKYKTSTSPTVIDPVEELRSLRHLTSEQEACIGRLNRRIDRLEGELRDARNILGHIEDIVRDGCTRALQRTINQLTEIVEDVVAEGVATGVRHAQNAVAEGVAGGVRLVLGNLDLVPANTEEDLRPRFPPPFNLNN